MTGNLSGMDEDEEIVFITTEIDGEMAAKTTIRPANKNITFSNN